MRQLGNGCPNGDTRARIKRERVTGLSRLILKRSARVEKDEDLPRVQDEWSGKSACDEQNGKREAIYDEQPSEWWRVECMRLGELVFWRVP